MAVLPFPYKSSEFPCPPGIIQNISPFFLDYLTFGRKKTYKTGDVIPYHKDSRKFFYVTRGILGFFFGQGEFINNFTGPNALHYEIYYFVPKTQNLNSLCLKDTEIYEFDYEFLHRLEQENPSALHDICQGITIKLISLSIIIKLVSIPFLPQRLATYLFYLFQYYNTRDIRFPLNQANIAILLRISKTSMIRIIREFKSHGLINRFERGFIGLENMDRLLHVVDTGDYDF